MLKLMTVVFSLGHLGYCMSPSAAPLQSLSLLPPSVSLALPAPPTEALPPMNNLEFILEDEANYTLASAQNLIPPARIAREQLVNLSLENSGSWDTLSDGSRIWRLRILSPGATDLYLVYDVWRITKPCELYVYNDDGSVVLGPYTYLDNWDGTNITPLTNGEAVTLEYVVPAGTEDIGELSVMTVLHGYRHFFNREERNRDELDAFGSSLPCMVNVACFPEYANEKNSVAMIIDPWGSVCSGTMLNSIAQNGEPLFLTASHCINGNTSNWIFYFNYESPQCEPSSNGSLTHSISNGTLLMSYPISDNALLRLSRSRPSTSFIPRFEAWSRSDVEPTSTHGIHHPRADVKKVHYDNDQAYSSDWNGDNPDTQWRLWQDIGVGEPGSSGSPLFDQNNRVIGQLHGGTTICDTTWDHYLVYGKLSIGWEGGGTPATRLRDWLDPLNTGAIYKNAYQPVSPANDICGAGVSNVTTLPASFSGSTIFALNNSSVNCLTGTNTAGDVMFTVELPCNTQVTVSTCNSNFDTQLFIYQTSSFNGCNATGVLIGCSDDNCGDQSSVTFSAVADEIYTVVLDGYGSASGSYEISFTGTPCTQQLTAPTDLTITPQTATSSVLLRWHSVPGAASYSIFCSDSTTAPFNLPQFLMVTVPDTNYVHSGALLLPKTRAYYCVTANP